MINLLGRAEKCKDCGKIYMPDYGHYHPPPKKSPIVIFNKDKKNDKKNEDFRVRRYGQMYDRLEYFCEKCRMIIKTTNVEKGETNKRIHKDAVFPCGGNIIILLHSMDYPIKNEITLSIRAVSFNETAAKHDFLHVVNTRGGEVVGGIRIVLTNEPKCNGLNQYVVSATVKPKGNE